MGGMTMDIYVWIPLVFAGLFLITDAAMLIRMITLLKKNKESTAGDLGDKLNPYLYATGAISVLMAICMILATVLR